MTTCSKQINSIGLALVFAGCMLLAYFGLPPDFDPTGARHLIMEDLDEVEIAKGKRYRRLGRIGVTLIAFGSVVQFVGIWVP
jgi:hypothetical protein